MFETTLIWSTTTLYAHLYVWSRTKVWDNPPHHSNPRRTQNNNNASLYLPHSTHKHTQFYKSLPFLKISKQLTPFPNKFLFNRGFDLLMQWYKGLQKFLLQNYLCEISIFQSSHKLFLRNDILDNHKCDFLFRIGDQSNLWFIDCTWKGLCDSYKGYQRWNAEARITSDFSTGLSVSSLVPFYTVSLWTI